MNIELAHGRLHLEVTGEATAPAVLWIHAFPLGGAQWRTQVDAIGGRRHVVPDLPGFGASPALPDAAPLTMDRAADILAATLDHLAIDRASAVGLSMGGYILMAMLRRHPDRIAAAVLADTRAQADTDEGKANREAFAVKVLEEGPKAATVLVPKLIASPVDGDVGRRVESLILTASAEGIAAASRGMALRPDSRPGLAEVSCPALALVGAEDGLTPPADARLIADAIPGATLVEIEGAGHLANLDRPAETTRAVEAFLDRVAAGASK